MGRPKNEVGEWTRYPRASTETSAVVVPNENVAHRHHSCTRQLWQRCISILKG